MQNVLEFRGLSVDFATPRGSVHALRDVSFAVPQNSIVGVVGESGCGKTTVISSAMRLLAPNADVRSGDVLFEGESLYAKSEEEMRAIRGERIAMVFQDPMTSLNPVLTIGRQMTDIQYRRKISNAERRAKAIAMLRRVGIPDPEERFDAYPHQFSGGMRQRISIAMALLMNPSLLIADEPTTALDVTMEAQIIHLLRELKNEFRGSILFVSHNLGLIAELCDYVVVMYAGEVVERAEVHDLFNNAAHPYTRALLECDPARIVETSRTLPTIPGAVPDLLHAPAGCVFQSRCPVAFAPCGTRPPDVTPRPGHVARCHRVAQTSPAPGLASVG